MANVESILNKILGKNVKSNIVIPKNEPNISFKSKDKTTLKPKFEESKIMED